MSQSEKTGMLYDQIIQRVIEDSRERFEAEGADMQVLGELQKLWWEKLQQSGIVGSSRGSGGMGGSGGYQQVQFKSEKSEDYALQFPSGAPPSRMAPSHSSAYSNLKVKSELPQTDGADVGESEAGVAASRPGRRPRRGDYVEVQISMGGEASGDDSEACLSSVDQLDGAGAGPRKRQRDDDDGNDDDLDDDDDPLNSEDDDEEDSEEALNTENLVLCQYDKVTRTKNKWKAQLKFGVMTLNLSDTRKQDFIFNKASADMNFAN